MNMLSILKKELRSHFSSLIAYVVIAMFLIVAGYSFYTYLVMFLTFVGSDLKVGLWQYTFHYLRFAPLTLIPLLTMRLFAEEKKMGTIELLFTAPLRDNDIILGKYIACLLVYMLMLALTLLYPALIAVYFGVEPGPLFACYLGLFLLGAACIACGTFVSSLTENQIVASIVTIAVLLTMWNLDWNEGIAGQQTIAVLHQVSLSEHFLNFIKGVVDSDSVIYYLSLVFFFLFSHALFFGSAHVERQMKKPATARKYLYVFELVLLVFLVAGSLGLANYISYRHKVRFDLTPAKAYTLAPLTERVLDTLSEPLNITIFHKRDELQQFQDLLDLLQRASNRLAFQFIDLDKNPARAASFDVTNYGAAIIEYQGRRERLKYFSEDNLVTALIRLTEKNKKIVRFVSGHGEKSLDAAEPVNSFNQVRQALQLENYRVEPMVLMNAPQVPDDTLILIIAGPQEDYLAHELEMIDRYLRQGGRVLMLADSFPLPRVEQFLLEQYKIELQRDYIIDTRSKLMGFDVLTPLITPDERHPIASSTNKNVVFPYCRSILPRTQSADEITQTVLAVSGPDSWAERNTQSVRDGSVSFDPGSDMAGPVPVAVIVELPPENVDASGGCLVVMGNSNFASDHYFNVVGNRDFFLNTINWLADQHDLLLSRGTSTATPDMYFMTKNQGQIIYWLCVIVQPALVLLCGLAVSWWRRRRT